MLQRKGRLASPLPNRYRWLMPKMMVEGGFSTSVEPMRGRRRSSQQKDLEDTCCVRRHHLRGGLHGTQAAAASRVLLVLDDGGGPEGAGHRLVALRAPGFYRCLHGAAAGMGVSAPDTGDARALLLVELAWSGELLNRTPAWGGNWLRRARGGRWINELHSSYPSGSVGHPAGLDAG